MSWILFREDRDRANDKSQVARRISLYLFFFHCFDDQVLYFSVSLNCLLRIKINNTWSLSAKIYTFVQAALLSSILLTNLENVGFVIYKLEAIYKLHLTICDLQQIPVQSCEVEADVATGAETKYSVGCYLIS